MTAEDVVALLSLALGVPAIVLQVVRQLGRISPRERLLQDIEIRNALHANSEAQQIMDRHIRDETRKLTGNDSKRRDPLGIGIALFFGGVGIGLAAVAVINGGAWWLLGIPAGLGLLFSVVGFAQDGVKRERDDRGRPV